MISIRRVTIENFQSHQKTVLAFEKGLNVIIGPSDQGKSAILRAIKWALYNEPRGTDFIRQGTSSARVTVELDSGSTVIRERSHSKNRYVVIYPDGTNTTFEGFGNEVPEEVVKAHGIPKVILDTDLSASLNMGDQLEGPFLLSETGAVRAKAIGRLTGLHIIDKALRDCLTDMRRENQTVDRLEGELKDTGEKLEEYRDLHLLEEKITASEQLIKRLEESIQRKNKLEQLLQELKDVTGETEEAKRILKSLEGLPQCEICLKTCQLNAERLNRLGRLTETLNNIESDRKNAQEALVKTEGLQNTGHMVSQAEEKNYKLARLQEAWGKLALCGEEIGKAEGFLVRSRNAVDCEKILEKISAKTGLLEKQAELRTQYQSFINGIREGEQYIEDNKAEVAELVKEYARQLKQAGKCPLCDSEISDVKLEEIIKHYEEAH